MKEVWSKAASRRTEIGYKAEVVRASKQVIAKPITVKGLYSKSGDCAAKVVELTPGDLCDVRKD